jgi:FKBP-type peptidyl-prolyl cis-trans isomerase FklB
MDSLKQMSKALALALVGLLAFAACQKQEAAADTNAATASADTASASTAAVSTSDLATADTSDDDISYAFGMMYGSDMGSYGIPSFDYAEFVQGVRDMISGTTRLSQADAYNVLNNTINAITAATSETNQAAQAAYLAENGAREGVVTTASGLQYEVVTQGDGAKPLATDKVMVHYEGTLIDGTVFDTTRDATTGVDTAVEFDLTALIPGFVEGLLLMNTGSTYILCVPSELAYGANGVQGVIPPYTPIIFTVTLDSIVTG